MNRFAVVFVLSLVGLVSGCASPSQNIQTGRLINLEEASAFERALLVSEINNTFSREDQIYTQPVNKKESCKLPSSKGQVERNNFRSFWDGQCKDGYAFGLGRDIAISDTHHVEEITIHNGTGKSDGSPIALYDFVNSWMVYAVPDDKSKANTIFREVISNQGGNFYVFYQLRVVDEAGNELISEFSPLSPMRTFANFQKNVVYKFSDNSSLPVINGSEVTFTAEIIDPKTEKKGGVALVRYANGRVRHFKLSDASPEDVVLPIEYVNSLNQKLQAVLGAQASAQTKLERARQMEREYLYLACNGKHVIDGLGENTATKICNWRNQFKDSYDKNLAKYEQNMRQRREQADIMAKQRSAQQQIADQQSRLELQQLVSSLGQIGQEMQNSGQQMLNSVNRQPPPQLTPFAPFNTFGSDRVRCVTVGPVTNCR